MKAFIQWLEEAPTQWSADLPNPYAPSGATSEDGSRPRAQHAYDAVMNLDDRDLPFLIKALRANPRWKKGTQETQVEPSNMELVS